MFADCPATGVPVAGIGVLGIDVIEIEVFVGCKPVGVGSKLGCKVGVHDGVIEGVRLTTMLLVGIGEHSFQSAQTLRIKNISTNM